MRLTVPPVKMAALRPHLAKKKSNNSQYAVIVINKENNTIFSGKPLLFTGGKHEAK